MKNHQKSFLKKKGQLQTFCAKPTIYPSVNISVISRYLSTLYSHPDFPEKSPKELRHELRDSIASNWVWKLVDPSSLYRYLSRVMKKRAHGQPISFTDLFGHLVGETLLKNVWFHFSCLYVWFFFFKFIYLFLKITENKIYNNGNLKFRMKIRNYVIDLNKLTKITGDINIKLRYCLY